MLKKNLIGWTVSIVSSLIPKRRLMVIAGMWGYSGNARAFYEALQEANFPCEVVWLAKTAKHQQQLDKASIRWLPIGTLRTFWAVARAKWLVSTHGELGRYKALWGQTYVNLWHGSGMKASGYLWNEEDGAYYRATVGRADISIVTSPLMVTVWSAICNLPATKVFPVGYPRNDILHDTEGAKQRLAQLVGAGKSESGRLDKPLDGPFDKVILYAPTHRKMEREGATAETEWTFQKFVDKYLHPQLDKLLKRWNALLVIKLHPAEEAHFADLADQFPSNIRYLMGEELSRAGLDIYDILSGFDMLWTDYSSMATDYMISQRPALFFIDDLDAYRQGRGVIFDDFDLFTPGPKVNSLTELLAAAERLASDPEYYRAERARFKQMFLAAEAPYGRNVIKLLEEKSG